MVLLALLGQLIGQSAMLDVLLLQALGAGVCWIMQCSLNAFERLDVFGFLRCDKTLHSNFVGISEI